MSVESKVVSGKSVSMISLSDIPDGEYQGVWGGYEVRVMIQDKTYQFTTNDGIRTMDAPCIVTAKDGKIIVKVK